MLRRVTTALRNFREQRLVQADELEDLFADWLAAKSARTREAYASDLRQFAAWVGMDVDAAVQRFVTSPGPTAIKVALGWKAEMKRRGYAPATINRRLSALRRIAKLGRSVGLCTFELDIEGERVVALKDTRGPGVDTIAALIAAAEADDRLVGYRDAAMLRWMYYLALRRIEIVRLDVTDYRPSSSSPMAALHRKGYHERTPFPVDVRAARSIELWLRAAGNPERGPLFPAFTRSQGGRIDTSTVNRIVTRRAIEAGYPGGRLPPPDGRRITPHGFRHTALTAVAVETGSILATQELGGHRDPRTTMRYLDNLGENVRRSAATLPDV